MVPPPEEEGITINFGTSDQGMFSEQNNTPTEQSETSPTESTQAEPEPVETVQEDILTQTSEEAVSIDKKEEKTKEVIEPVEKKEEPKPDENLTNALNKWKKQENRTRR